MNSLILTSREIFPALGDRAGLSLRLGLAIFAAVVCSASAQWIPLTNGTPSERGYAPMSQDTLRGRVEIKESRSSKSKPGLGFVRYTARLYNQRGDYVFVTTSTLIVRSRERG